MVSHPLAEKTDAELVALTLDNQQFFAYLIERYEKKLLRYIIRFSHVSLQEAEDTLQEVFLKAYLHLRAFDADLSFSSWIYRITRNEMINQYRKAKVRPHGNSIQVDDRVIESIAADGDVLKSIDRRILRAHLEALLDGLDVKYREVLILRFFEEKNYDEISDIVKKPTGTVATLLNRAKKQLYKAFMQQAELKKNFL